MRVFLIITAILCVRLTMGATDNNYCDHNPGPNIRLHEFKAWDCSSDDTSLDVDVSASHIPICVKGNFSIGSENPGPFSIVYVASVTGTIMGFFPYLHQIDMCAGGPCYMTVNCQELKVLLGAPNANDPNCLLTTGNVDFVVTTSLDGPVDLPQSVVNGISGASVNTEIDVDANVMAGITTKLACILEEMPIDLQK